MSPQGAEQLGLSLAGDIAPAHMAPSQLAFFALPGRHWQFASQTTQHSSC